MSSSCPTGWLRGEKLTWAPPVLLKLWYLPNTLAVHTTCNSDKDNDNDDDDDDDGDDDDDDG